MLTGKWRSGLRELRHARISGSAKDEIQNQRVYGDKAKTEGLRSDEQRPELIK